jgi:hypothetical protein
MSLVRYNKKKRIFFDEEFTGLRQNTTLISIGLISDCGKTFYAEFTDFDYSQIDDWLRSNVLCHTQVKGILSEDMNIKPFFISSNIMDGTTTGNITMLGDTDAVKYALAMWLESFGCELEMWSDCLSYDWVLFCDIFGSAFGVPKCVNYIPLDICTLFVAAGIDPDINREEFVYGKDEAEIVRKAKKHSASWDAKIIRMCFIRLTKIYLPNL